MPILRSGSRAARRREWLAQTRLRAGLERSLQRRVGAEIRRTASVAARALVASGPPGVMEAMASHPARVRRLLAGHYRRVFGVFGRQLRDEFKAAAFVLETKDSESFFELAIQRWLVGHGADKITRIGDTTQQQILAAVLAGETAGEGIPAIAKRIRASAGGVIAKARSIVIARTETHSAAGAASDEMARALGVADVLKREWIAAEDNRTRTTHIAADGQIRGMDEPFDVGGAKLQFPGDPAGPAAEVINCRCVLGFITPDP